MQQEGPRGFLLAFQMSHSRSQQKVTPEDYSHMGFFVEDSESGREDIVKGQCGGPAPPPVGPDCTVKERPKFPGDWGCTVGASVGCTAWNGVSFRIISHFGCDYNAAITHSKNVNKLFLKFTFFTHKFFLLGGNLYPLLLFSLCKGFG